MRTRITMKKNIQSKITKLVLQWIHGTIFLSTGLNIRFTLDLPPPSSCKSRILFKAKYFKLISHIIQQLSFKHVSVWRLLDSHCKQVKWICLRKYKASRAETLAAWLILLLFPTHAHQHTHIYEYKPKWHISWKKGVLLWGTRYKKLDL